MVFEEKHNSSLFSSICKEILGVLEEFRESCETNQHTTPNMYQCVRRTGYFCSDTVFNLSNQVLSEIDIRVLEKGQVSGPILAPLAQIWARKFFFVDFTSTEC